MGMKQNRLKDATERIKVLGHKIAVKFCRNYIAGRLRRAKTVSQYINSKAPRRCSDLLIEMYLIQKIEGYSDIQQARWLFCDKWLVPVKDMLIASRPDYWVPLLIWWITSR